MALFPDTWAGRTLILTVEDAEVFVLSNIVMGVPVQARQKEVGLRCVVQPCLPEFLSQRSLLQPGSMDLNQLPVTLHH